MWDLDQITNFMAHIDSKMANLKIYDMQLFKILLYVSSVPDCHLYSAKILDKFWMIEKCISDLLCSVSNVYCMVLVTL